MKKNKKSINKKTTLLSSVIVACSIIIPAHPTLANPIIEIFEDRFIKRDYDRRDDDRFYGSHECRSLPFHHKRRGKISKEKRRRWSDHGHRRCIKHRGDGRYHRHDSRGWIPYKNWEERYSDKYRYWGDENDWRDDWRDENDWRYWRHRSRKNRYHRERDWKDRRDDRKHWGEYRREKWKNRLEYDD